MKKLIDNILKESSELGVELGKASSFVRYIENEFGKRMKFNMPFEYTIIDGANSGCKISWERHKESKKKIFRLYLKKTDETITALQECNVETKLEFNKYVAPFLEAFCEYIKGKKIEAKNAIPEISDDELEWIKTKNAASKIEKIKEKIQDSTKFDVLHDKAKSETVTCMFCGETFDHNEKSIPDYCSSSCYKMGKMKNSYL